MVFRRVIAHNAPLMQPHHPVAEVQHLPRRVGDEEIVLPSARKCRIRAMHFSAKLASPTLSASSTIRISGFMWAEMANPSRERIPLEYVRRGWSMIELSEKYNYHGARQLLCGDFETTTTPDDCRVWAWGVCHIESESISTGIDIDSFWHGVLRRRAWSISHNLIFDSAFIIDRIMKLGYEYTDDNRPSNIKSHLCHFSARENIHNEN